MNENYEMSDAVILEEMGRWLQRERLDRNISQATLARRCGLARKTVTNLETGRGGTVKTLIALLRGLSLLSCLDPLLIPAEETGTDPAKPRLRARSSSAPDLGGQGGFHPGV